MTAPHTQEASHAELIVGVATAVTFIAPVSVDRMLGVDGAGRRRPKEGRLTELHAAPNSRFPRLQRNPELTAWTGPVTKQNRDALHSRGFGRIAVPSNGIHPLL